MNYPKSTLDQTQEIERLVADVLEKLDQVRYSLQTLEKRLKEGAVGPSAAAGPDEAAGPGEAAAGTQASASEAPRSEAPPSDSA
ncbi:MAG TPA: hypothetical protein VGG41_16280 [Solirubrobacteraceae bacterium]